MHYAKGRMVHLQCVFELSHSQILQDASLKFVHGVVVVVQQDPGCADVQAVCTENASVVRTWSKMALKRPLQDLLL